LREQGVTIFVTTHRLEEAERLCDRVAILNTTLRLIGRPDELRAQLFRRSVDVRLRAALDDPQGVFGAVPEVERWEQTPAGYTMTVSDPDLATPALARALVRADADILLLAESHHSLEDVYLELIDEDVEAKAR
jgi:ABC-2 type transport system ATP-binding protein